MMYTHVLGVFADSDAEVTWDEVLDNMEVWASCSFFGHVTSMA